MKTKLFLIFTLTIFSIYLISSAAISPTTFSVEPDTNKNYVITIDNNDIWPDGNITEVNITVPAGLGYIDKSNSTTSSYEFFRNESNILVWENNTDDEGYLINGTDSKTFSFRANGSTFGDYNITILVISNATHSVEYGSLVSIEDTTEPSISFNSPTPTSDSSLAQNFIPAEVSASDNIAIDTITIFIYGSTGLLSNSSDDTSPHSINFTGLIDGTYYINATVNDTFGNEDSTSTRTITLNTSSTTPTTTLPTNTTTPEITITTETCTPNWDCGDWKPEECEKGETQEKLCTDLNDCSGDGPETTIRNCVDGGVGIGKILVIAIGVIVFLTITAVTVFYIKGKFGVGSKLNNLALGNSPPPAMPKVNFPKRPPMRIPRLPRRAPMNAPASSGKKPLMRRPPMKKPILRPKRSPMRRNPQNKPL